MILIYLQMKIYIWEVIKLKKCKKFILLMIFSIVISFNTQNVFAINGVTILKQPVDAYSVSGATVSYTVEAAGTGLTYQWQYSLDGGKTWLISTGWTRATCSFKGAENYSGRQFRCVVKDASGNSVTSVAAKYICGVQLSIKSQPKDVTAKAGETVSYTVEAAGTGLTYQWQYSLDGGKTWQTSTGWTRATCSFKGAENYSGRQFRCVVKDASGNSVTSEAAKYICITSTDDWELPIL